MVAGSSPEWLPPGFAEKVKYKNGRKIKYYYNNATGSRHYSKQDVLRCATADNDLHSAPQTSEGGGKGLSSNEKDNAVLDKPNDSSQWLPNGWMIEEKTRKSGLQEGMPYKVYVEPSTGNKFYSRAAVTRYLSSIDHSTTITSQNKLDNVDKPVPDTPQCISHTNAGSISENKRKSGSFKMVATETTIDDDLPPGWIKEIRTSKSGSRIRKDPFYIDPASSYMFRSKKDVLRFLRTNDIRRCACRPLKIELDDLKLNEIPSSNPANEKLSNHNEELFPSDKSKSNDGGEASCKKGREEPEAENFKQTQDNKNVSDHVENNSNEILYRSEDMENNCEPANEVAEEDPRIMNAADPLSTKQQLSENGTERGTDRTQPSSRKSKKRGAAGFPLRTSKRLARCEPEVLPGLHLSERSLRAMARKSLGSEVFTSPVLREPTNIPLPPDELTKEATEPPSVSKKALEATELGKKLAEPLPVSKETLATEPGKEADEPVSVSKETLEVTEAPGKVEKPQCEERAILDNPVGGKTSEKQLDSTKESQELPPFRFDFGESWSDPLEFAVKTLRGDISIEDTLKLSNCFSKPVGVVDNPVNGSLKSSQSDPPTNPFPFMQYNRPDGYLKSSQSDAWVNFQSEFLPNAGSFQQQSNNTVHSLPGNDLPPFSAPGNNNILSFSGFNSQSSTQAGKNNFPTNANH